MKTYQVHYFGLLAERRGLSEETVTLDAATPAEVWASVAAIHPLGASRTAMRAAVNDEFVPWEHPLRDGDRIALLPPMSGG